MVTDEEEKGKPSGPKDTHSYVSRVYSDTDTKFGKDSGLYKNLAKLAEIKKEEIEELKMKVKSKRGLIEVEVPDLESLGKHGNSTIYIDNSRYEIVEETTEGKIIEIGKIIKVSTDKGNLKKYRVRDFCGMFFDITTDGEKANIEHAEESSDNSKS